MTPPARSKADLLFTQYKITILFNHREIRHVTILHDATIPCGLKW
jgi:hypothetical protein